MSARVVISLAALPAEGSVPREAIRAMSFARVARERGDVLQRVLERGGSVLLVLDDPEITPQGKIDYDACLLESLTALKRAGADVIFTYAALDAARLGFDVTVKLELCRAIDLNGSLEAAKADMLKAGVTLA